MLRWRTRARRWTSSRSGSFSRRIPGIGFPAAKSTHNLCLQTVGFGGVFRLDHFLFFANKIIHFLFDCITRRGGELFHKVGL
jgi:hypothetical protein